MGLEALELFEWAQPRVPVVQADHVADGDLAAVGVVQERAAVGVAVQRPAGGVNHQTRLMPGRVDLPQLLDADAVGLRVLAFVQRVTRDQLAAEMAARAFGEDRVFRLQRHAALERRADAAILLDTHVAGGHADHFTVVAVQHLGCGEAGEDRHFQRLGLLRQPAGHFAQADDVVAFVVEALRQQRVGRAARAGFAEEQEFVTGDLLLQRCAALGPVREQLGQRARIHHRTRQHVRAWFGPLLQHAHRQLAAGFDRALAQADRGGQAGGAGADDHHVEFHYFTRGQGVGFSAHRLHDSWVGPASGPPAVPGNRACSHERNGCLNVSGYRAARDRARSPMFTSRLLRCSVRLWPGWVPTLVGTLCPDDRQWPGPDCA